MSIRGGVKRLMCGLRLYSGLDCLRQLPTIAKWLRSGCPSPAPHAVKMRVVRSYLRKYRLGTFIETGTYRGDTLMLLAAEGVDCVSVELSQELHRLASRLFARRGNIKLVQGDSGEVIPRLLETLDKAALFWLDGHYSGGSTAKGLQDSPIAAELRAIFGHGIGGHVILIDDARCFTGRDGYPHLDHLLAEIREEGKYLAEVSTDIIRLIPRK